MLKHVNEMCITVIINYCTQNGNFGRVGALSDLSNENKTLLRFRVGQRISIYVSYYLEFGTTGCANALILDKNPFEDKSPDELYNLGILQGVLKCDTSGNEFFVDMIKTSNVPNIINRSH